MGSVVVALLILREFCSPPQPGEMIRVKVLLGPLELLLDVVLSAPVTGDEVRVSEEWQVLLEAGQGSHPCRNIYTLVYDWSEIRVHTHPLFSPTEVELVSRRGNR